MRTAHLLRHSLAWFALLGVCLPVSARAAEPARLPVAAERSPATNVSDVALAHGGLLTGQFLDAQMKPVSGADVAISSGGHIVATTATDENGAFAVTGLRSGFHQVTTPDAVENCRLWADGTAPPRAEQGLRIVAGDDAVRGQWGPPPATNNFIKRAKVWGTNPFIVGGVIAAAVAIPVALNNDDDGPSS